MYFLKEKHYILKKYIFKKMEYEEGFSEKYKLGVRAGDIYLYFLVNTKNFI